MKTTALNKLKDFKGPKKHGAIIRQIHEDAIKLEKKVSLSFIEKTVAFFFSAYGFPIFFKGQKSFRINQLGSFVRNSAGWKFFRHVNIVRRRNARFSAMRIKATRKRKHKKSVIKKAKQKYRHNTYLWVKLDFEKRNAHFREIGWKEWTWEEYCSITKNNKQYGRRALLHYPDKLLPK